MPEWRYSEAEGWHPFVAPDPSVAEDVWVITEITRGGSTGEVFTVTDRMHVTETLSFLASEESSWSIVHNGQPVVFALLGD